MKFRLTGSNTPLYERADGSSMVIERLPAGAIVTVLDKGIEGILVRVTTDSDSGYLAAGTLVQPWLIERPAEGLAAFRLGASAAGANPSMGTAASTPGSNATPNRSA